MQCPTRCSDLGHDAWALKVFVAQRLSVEIADQQNPQVGSVVDNGCAHPRLRSSPAVVLLLVPVDAKKGRGGVGEPSDVDASWCGDLDVAIGEAAGEILDLPRLPGDRGQLIEQCVQFRRVERERPSTDTRHTYSTSCTRGIWYLPKLRPVLLPPTAAETRTKTLSGRSQSFPERLLKHH